jgi:hypothetical protein
MKQPHIKPSESTARSTLTARMFARFVLIAFVLSGCVSSSPQRSADQLRAEQVARSYAIQSLGLSESQIAKLKANFDGCLVDGREMMIQFYDPKYLQPNEVGILEPMLGGFPGYFDITVDIHTWKVVHHYASRE